MKILNNNNEYKTNKELEKKARKIFNNSKEYKTLEQLKEMNKAEKKADKKLEKKAWKEFKKERKLFYKTHPWARRHTSPPLPKLPPSEVVKKSRKLDSVNDKNEEPSVIKRLIEYFWIVLGIIAVIFYLLAFLGGIFNPESKTQEEFEFYQDINEPRGP